MKTAHWSRDFALVGGATGAAAPFFVIFDPTMALVGGLVGALSGGLLGVVSAWVTARTRGLVPLPVLVAAMAAAGGCWGAVTGAAGGLASWSFGPAGAAPGFVLGATTGMVTLGGMYLPYVVASVRGSSTWPVVAGTVLLSPFLGWLGLAALIGSTFGLWLFAMPAVVWAAVAVDRQIGRIDARRALGDGALSR